MSLFSLGSNSEAHAAFKDYYLVVPSGYEANSEDGTVFEPLIYQPTPAGLRLLVDKFCRETSHDLRLVDQRKQCPVGDNALPRFEKLKETFDFTTVTESHPVGLILSHG